MNRLRGKEWRFRFRYEDDPLTLTQTADGSIQADVVEVGLGGLPVTGVLLGPVLHGEHLLLAVLCVGVEVDLGVHAHHWRRAET